MGGQNFLQQDFSFRSFQNIFFFALFLSCLSIVFLDVPVSSAAGSASEEVVSPVFQVYSESESSIFDGNHDQCVVFEKYTLSQGKKKPVLNRLIKKRRVNIPNSAEAPEPAIVTSPTPEVFTFVLEQDFSLGTLKVSQCPRAP